MLSSLLALASGCVATISQPRGEAHLQAMRDATRHYHHGRVAEAATAWEEASRTAERRVDRDEADYRRARALVDLDRPRDAIALLDDLGAREPISRRTIRARFDAALLRLELGETERAHASLLAIVRERPGDGPASRALRILLEARRDTPAASRLAFLRELFEQVHESDLGDDLLTEEAEILRAEGDRAGAIRVLEQLVVTYPYPHGQRWDDALWRLADMAEEVEDYEEAVRQLARMLSIFELTIVPGSQTLPRMPEAAMRIARILRDHVHDVDRAAQAFRSMHDRFDTSRLRDDALYELGAMLLDAGRTSDGCGALRQVVEEIDVGHARRLALRRIEADCGR